MIEISIPRLILIEMVKDTIFLSKSDSIKFVYHFKNSLFYHFWHPEFLSLYFRFWYLSIKLGIFEMCVYQNQKSVEFAILSKSMQHFCSWSFYFALNKHSIILWLQYLSSTIFKALCLSFSNLSFLSFLTPWYSIILCFPNILLLANKPGKLRSLRCSLGKCGSKTVSIILLHVRF